MTNTRDANVGPFWTLLEGKLAQRPQGPMIRLVFGGRNDLGCRVRVVDGQPLVVWDDELRSQMSLVDESTILKVLADGGRTKKSFLTSRSALQNEPSDVSLNALACGLHGPIKSPQRTTQQYSANREYRIPTDELTALLGQPWRNALEAEKELTTITDAAQAAAVAGLLQGIVAKTHVDDNEDDDESATMAEEEGTTSGLEWNGARNEIWFGPPGTGKSHGIQKRLKDFKVDRQRIRRMTFHPETTYFDLVGNYRPAVLWLEDPIQPGHREPRTYYKFAPGPLAELLVSAARQPEEWHALVIEEINRGNCAAIFGDIFQLLDRVERSVDGEPPFGCSQYEITATPELAEWLAIELKDVVVGPYPVFDPTTKTLRLPPRLLILASMNTADQGLFPMDTAFKRRWAMHYVPIAATEGPDVRVPLHRKDAHGVAWRTFFTVVNKHVVDHTGSDDKQMGPWFLGQPSKIVEAQSFCSKVLHYLWSDVFRGAPGRLFEPEVKTYDVLVDNFHQGKHVLHKALREELALVDAKLSGGVAITAAVVTPGADAD
jgi:hypothetical protein